MIYAVRDPVRNRKGKIVKAGVYDKRLLCIETEFSAVLKQFTRDSNILSNTLRQAWDGKDVLRTLTKESPLKATGAHISIIGHATPADLRRYVTDLDIANGVLNRFVCVASERPRLVPSPRPLSREVRASLVESVGAIVKHAEANSEPVRRTKQASEMWDDVYRRTLSRERPGLLGSLLARGPVHVTRLELLFSAMDCSRRRKRAHLTSALAWWDYVAASTAIIFADRTGNDAADRIRSEMEFGDEMTVSKIREELFANKISSGRLRDALDLLVQLGEFEITKRRTKGRSAEVVRRVAFAKPVAA